MKGDPKLIKVLNSLLADELTAINQYMVHSEMCDNWGYDKLHKAIEKRAIDEMKHAEKLIGRILFLEGLPDRQRAQEALHRRRRPQDVRQRPRGRGRRHQVLQRRHQPGRRRSRTIATREILEYILKDEDAHIDEIEEVQDQIGQMGLQIFLTTQVG